MVVQVAIKEKLMDEIGIFIQNLISNGPKEYRVVREIVMKRFNLSKTKAGNVIHKLKRDRCFLCYTFSYESLQNGILFLPGQEEEARKMFRKIRESIPKPIRYANKKLHNYLIQETRKIVAQNKDLPTKLLLEIVKWKLKVSEPVAKKLIGEVFQFHLR